MTAGGNLTISMGAGTGALSLVSGLTAGNFTVDASTFGGAIDVTNVTASGAGTVSIGTAGDFSVENITQGAFTLDGAAASTGSVTLTGVTAGGNLTISMGTGREASRLRRVSMQEALLWMPPTLAAR